MSTPKRRNYYNNGSNQKKRKHFYLEAGMTGFLCTCNFHEKDCVRDAYKLLNEYADEIYGPENKKGCDNDSKVPITETDVSIDEDEKDDEEDISTALNKEISDLKTEYAKPLHARRFQVVDTDVKNVVFIKSTLTNPLELVTKIITELHKTKEQHSRFLLRLLPVEIVCKANMNDIRTRANVVLEKYFAQEPKTFAIVFNRHSNKNIHRDEIIEDLAEIISKKNPGNKTDLKNPELAVIVEVIRGVCLLSVAPNYYKYRKYNLLEICNTKEPANTSQKTDTENNEEENSEETSKEETNLSEEAEDN